MRRFLPAAVIAFLVVAVASPVNAGYLIIRVILEGSSGSGGSPQASGPGVPGPGTYGPATGAPLSGPPMGSGLGPPGGLKPPGGMKPPGPGPMMPPAGNPGTGTRGPIDPTRSLVVVIPVTEELTAGSPFYPGRADPHTNPFWKPKLHVTLRGAKITTNLFTDSSTVQWYESLVNTPAYRRTRAMDVLDRHARWAKTKSDPKALYDITAAALAAGMVEEALNYSDELLAAVGDKAQEQAPEVAGFVRAYGAMQKGVRGTPQKRGRDAYWQAKLDAKGTVTDGHYALVYWDADPAEVQRRAAMLEENFRGFYLAHALRGIELPVPDAPLVAVLAKRGSDVLPLARALDVHASLPADGFYSPDHDLLVLSPERLDDLGQTFTRQAQQVYTQGVSRDALLAGKGPKIHADGHKDEKKPNDVVMKPDDVAWMQTLALVDRFVDEDAAVFAASREGSRQLLHATGQLPRYVALPEWVTAGGSNVFARPRDPAFLTDADGKWRVSVAPTTGYGGPNPTLQRYFRDLVEKKDLNTDRAELLRNVLADAYFRGLRDPREVNDPDPEKEDKSGVALTTGGGQPANPGTGIPTGPMGPMGIPGKPMGGPGGSASGPPMPGGFFPGVSGPGSAPATPPAEDPIAKLRKKRERLAVKAQATSWALYFYLARERPAELRKFLDELSAMPRDLPIDGATATAAFCRAFALDGSKESLRRFADKWFDYLGTVAPASIDVPLVDPKPPAQTATGGTPMTPGSGPVRPGTGPGGSGPP